jgi:hypothetical protein
MAEETGAISSILLPDSKMRDGALAGVLVLGILPDPLQFSAAEDRGGAMFGDLASSFGFRE